MQWPSIGPFPLHLLASLMIGSMLDGMDGAFFGSIQKGLLVDEHLNMSPDHLGSITTMALAVTMVAGPVWTVGLQQMVTSPELAASFGPDRVLAIAALAWGGTSVLLGRAGSFAVFLMLRAVNAAFLAVAMPVVMWVVADNVASHDRGKWFGILQFVTGVGTTIGQYLGVRYSDVRLQSMSQLVWMDSSSTSSAASRSDEGGDLGWRMGVSVIGLLSIAFAVLVFVLAPSQPLPCRAWFSRKQPSHRELLPRRMNLMATLQESLSTAKENTLEFGSSLTFRMLVCQGIVGCIGQQGKSFLALWMQTGGWPNSRVAAILTAGSIGAKLAAPVSGVLSDWLERYFDSWSGEVSRAQHHGIDGRLLYGVVANVLKVSCAAALLGVPTYDDLSIPLIASLVVILDIVSSGAQVAMTKPVMSNIARPGPHTAAMVASEITTEQVVSMWVPMLVYHMLSSSGFDAKASSEDGKRASFESLQTIMLQCCIAGWGLAGCSIQLLQSKRWYQQERAVELARRRNAESSAKAIVMGQSYTDENAASDSELASMVAQ